MGNCLVTKLNGLVSADLPKIGEAQVVVKHASSFDLQMNLDDTKIVFSTPCALKRNGVSQGTVSEYTAGAGEALYLITIPANTEVTISIMRKYGSIKVLNTSNLTLDYVALKWFAMTNVIVMNVTATSSNDKNLKDLCWSGMRELRTDNVYGNLEDVKVCTNMARLRIDGNAPGNINEALTPLTKLTECDISGVGTLTGSWETLFNAWATAGKNTTGNGVIVSTGTASFNGLNTNQIIYVKFGTGMVDPTAEDTERGWQWSYVY